jgi:hypothetical protein
MKGIEFLRGVYMSSGLSIRPLTNLSPKSNNSSRGLNSDQVMSKEALAQANVTVIGQAQLEQGQITQLTVALKQQVVKKVFESQSLKSTNSCMGEVARERFELSSSGPKPDMLDHYTNGLQCYFAGLVWMSFFPNKPILPKFGNC